MDETKGKLCSDTVKEYGLNAGAAMVGIAAASDFGSAPDDFRPSDNLENCRSVIVLAAPFSKESLQKTSVEYTETRNETYKRMDSIAKEVAKQIRKTGYKAKAIGGIGGKKWVDGINHGHISLKHAAELAGLGTIGKNYLLINPEYGTRLWFSAVLTDADLAPDKMIRHSFCDDCNKCVEACPSNALDDITSFGKKVCARTCFKMVDGKWMLVCFLCRKVCPYCFGEEKDGTN
jgi:Uncharacterized Fe-S protein